MGRGLGELQQRILTIVDRERTRGLSAHTSPTDQLDAYKITAEIFGPDAGDVQRRNVQRALAALETRGLVSSFIPPARRCYF